jgi:hypothetical protein
MTLRVNVRLPLASIPNKRNKTYDVSQLLAVINYDDFVKHDKRCSTHFLTISPESQKRFNLKTDLVLPGHLFIEKQHGRLSYQFPSVRLGTDSHALEPQVSESDLQGYPGQA